MNQHDPNRPFVPEDGFITNSPFNPNSPQSVAYQPPKKKHTARNIALAVVMVFVGVITAAVLSGGQQPTSSPQAPTVVVTTADNGPTPDPVVTPTNKPSATKTTQPAPKPTKAAPKFTMAQEQAIGTAEDYLNGQSFSRKGLIEQLVFEGFSTKDATFGVDHVTVNWNSQAVEVAKGYLNGQHFSRAGLIEQLEYEGFTHKQAVYGVNKAGL